MAFLEINKINIDYVTEDGVVEAVNDIDLSLKEGESLGLVGETGAGKTTLAKCIMRILPERTARINSGEIFYKGTDLLKLEPEKMREIRGSEIAMIFQDPMTALNPVLTVGEQIAEAVQNHQKVDDAEAMKKAEEMLELVGIPAARSSEYPHQFSGGMRQRVVIAIAVACNPEILICDEPTTALDVTIQAQILDLLRDLQKRYGLTVIYITHDLGVVASVSDRIAVMYAGDIVEIGRSDEIFYDPRHPYTWALLSSLPQLGERGEDLFAIAGTPPNLFRPIKGDAFAPRNPYALKVDFQYRPPYFDVSPTHKARTWLLDPRAPKVERPKNLDRIREMGGFIHE